MHFGRGCQRPAPDVVSETIQHCHVILTLALHYLSLSMPAMCKAAVEKSKSPWRFRADWVLIVLICHQNFRYTLHSVEANLAHFDKPGFLSSMPYLRPPTDSAKDEADLSKKFQRYFEIVTPSCGSILARMLEEWLHRLGVDDFTTTSLDLIIASRLVACPCARTRTQTNNQKTRTHTHEHAHTLSLPLSLSQICFL